MEGGKEKKKEKKRLWLRENNLGGKLVDDLMDCMKIFWGKKGH